MQPKCSQNAAKMQSKCSQDSVKMQSKCSQNSSKIQSKCSQNAVKMQSKCSQNVAKMQPKMQPKMQSKCSQNAVKMQQKCSQNAAKMQSKFSQNSVTECLQTENYTRNSYLDHMLRAKIIHNFQLLLLLIRPWATLTEFAFLNRMSSPGIHSKSLPSTWWKLQTRMEMTCFLTSLQNLQVGKSIKLAQDTK